MRRLVKPEQTIIWVIIAAALLGCYEKDTVRPVLNIEININRDDQHTLLDLVSDFAQSNQLTIERRVEDLYSAYGKEVLWIDYKKGEDVLMGILSSIKDGGYTISFYDEKNTAAWEILSQTLIVKLEEKWPDDVRVKRIK